MSKIVLVVLVVVGSLTSGCAASTGAVSGSSMPSGAPAWVGYPLNEVVKHTIVLSNGKEKEVLAVHAVGGYNTCGNGKPTAILMNACTSTYEGGMSVEGDVTTTWSNEELSCSVVIKSGQLEREANWSDSGYRGNLVHCLLIRH